MTNKDGNMGEVQKFEQPEQAVSPVSILQQAMQSGMNLDGIEKMMELQERWDRQQAKKAYVSAMAKFKANPPKINKDKTVSYGQGKAGYAHASLANVTEKINAALSAHGLSAAWSTEQNGDMITVTCTITHDLGYSESTSLSAKPDATGSKNPIQAIGSTVSYLERYTILALTGLATHDQGNDASDGKPPEYVNHSQLAQIRDLLKKTGDKDKFLAWMGVETDEEILSKDFPKAVNALNQKLKATGGK